MSSRVGGGRARRIRARGGARKTDRAPKSAADLDAEMEVCIFDTFCCLTYLRFWSSGLYCQQWSCCRCLSNFDFSLLFIVNRLSMLSFFLPIQLLLFIPSSDSSVSIEQCLFLSCHALVCNVVIANISYTNVT